MHRVTVCSNGKVCGSGLQRGQSMWVRFAAVAKYVGQVCSNGKVCGSGLQQGQSMVGSFEVRTWCVGSLRRLQSMWTSLQQ